MDIEVRVPDVNESESDFTVVENYIRFGMSAVRNVGEGVSELIINTREEGGKFVDFYDFCERVDIGALNKRTIESLAKAGGFDSLGHTRKGLLMTYEMIVDNVVSRRREREAGIMSLFGDVSSEEGNDSSSRITISDSEFEKTLKLTYEKEMLGLYISDHPLAGLEKALNAISEKTVMQAKESVEGNMITVGGVITALNRRYTKKGELMATFVLEDLTMGIEVMVFPKTMAVYSDRIAEDSIVLVQARVDARDDAVKLIAMDITKPELQIEGSGPPLRLKISSHSLTKERADELHTILSRYPGDSPVFLHISDKLKETIVRFGANFAVDAPSSSLRAELISVLGDGCVF
jgi:DNA polymerase-3 subunit alpha